MTRRVARWVFFLPFVALLALVVYLDQHREDATCGQLAENRQVLREVVLIATEPGGSTSIDFGAIDHFDELEPATQAYFVALGDLLAAGSTSSGDSRRVALLAAIPDIEC